MSHHSLLYLLQSLFGSSSVPDVLMFLARCLHASPASIFSLFISSFLWTVIVQLDSNLQCPHVLIMCACVFM